MRAEKSAPECLAASGCDLRHGKPTRIGGHDGPGRIIDSTRSNRARLASSCSTTASITHSTPDSRSRWSSKLPGSTRRNAASSKNGAGLSLPPPLSALARRQHSGFSLPRTLHRTGTHAGRIGKVCRNLRPHGPGAQYSRLAKRKMGMRWSECARSTVTGYR